jgi:hypothetical protein
VVFLAAISAYYGLEKMGRFEVAAISIDWLVLVVNGVLLSVLFRRRLKASGGRAGNYRARIERGEGPSYNHDRYGQGLFVASIHRTS